MSELEEQPGRFKVDTSRPRSRTKMRSKMRHVLAVASGMFPLMGAFVFAMSFFRLPVERAPYNNLAIVFVACGMVSLMFYAWTRAEKQRRHEISARNRELKYRNREEAFRKEQAKIEARKAAAVSKEA